MVRLIGMGPGAIRYLTPDAVEKIKVSSKVLAFGRISKTAERIKTPVIKVNKVSELTEHLQSHEDVAILASGDPCFYGILEYLKNNCIRIDEVVPGLSSFQYMMSRLQKSWHEAQMVSLHGRADDMERIIRHKLSIVLTDSYYTPDLISKELYRKGMRGKIYAGYNLSYADECILVKNIGEAMEYNRSLAVVVIENEMGKR